MFLSIKSFTLIISIFILLIVASLCLTSHMYLVASACLMLVIAVVPLFSSLKFDLFSSWNFLLYSIVVGVFLRAVYITFELSKPDVIHSLFLRGENIDFLFWPSILMAGGLLFFTIGYLVPKRKLPVSRLKIANKNPAWDTNKYRLISIIILFISAISLFLFIRVNGIESFVLEAISKHRGLSSDLSEYRSYSYLRLLVSLSDIVVYISFAKLNMSKKGKPFDYALLLAGLLISLSFYVLVSSRGGAVVLIINLLAISYYLNHQKLKLKVYLPLMIFGLAMMILLTSLRKAGTIRTDKNWSEYAFSALDPFVFALNLIDVSKTAHIIRAIPVKLETELGGTYLPLLFSWVPRSLWPDKPVVNVDNIIGFQVYDATVFGSGGVPAGLIAESFWNFSYGGVIIFSLLAGMTLRLVANTFNSNKANVNFIIIHVYCFMFFGVAMLGSSFNSTVIGILTNLIPLILVLTFITRNRIN